MRPITIPLAAGALLVAMACADQTPVSPTRGAGSPANTTTSPGSGPWARVVTGETGPGSLYALYIPRDWNGDAIYFAHGVRPPLDPITLDLNQDNFFEVRDAVGAEGYAFAYSSFSENGLAIKDGAQRTHQLRGLLTSELKGQPKRSFLAGYSLGALVTLDLAERFPGEYDGLLAMCGMVGGTPRQIQFIGDVRALFDFFYPGVLPGNVTSVSGPPLTQDEVQALVVAAISANPFGMFAIASASQTPLAYAPFGSLTDPSSPASRTLAQSLIVALYYQLLAAPDVMGRTHGHSPYDNRHTVYTLGTSVIPDPGITAFLESLITGANAGVTRYDSPPDARNYLDNYYSPTGRLQIPVVSVHNAWDYLAPEPVHEPAFHDIVKSAGALDMLLQRTVPNYGHCNFDTPIVVGSFQTLVNWVTTGVKPAS
jgi:pimeloyl-ACP methyl ester carboxylesterase